MRILAYFVLFFPAYKFSAGKKVSNPFVHTKAKEHLKKPKRIYISKRKDCQKRETPVIILKSHGIKGSKNLQSTKIKIRM